MRYSSDIVVIVGLESAAQYNYRAAEVVEPSADDPPAAERIPVQLIHGNNKRLSIRRRNLLRASHDEDRAALLTRVVLLKQQELRVCRKRQKGRQRRPRAPPIRTPDRPPAFPRSSTLLLR